MDFKFEASINLFGSQVILAPMDENEVGFRAPENENGIQILKAKLEEAGIVPKGSAIASFIPDYTEIRTLVYNKKTKSVELAVKAEMGEDFVLNKYKHIFTLNSVSIYLGATPQETAPNTTDVAVVEVATTDSTATDTATDVPQDETDTAATDELPQEANDAEPQPENNTGEAQ